MSGQHWQQHDLKPGPARDLVDRSGISAGERVWEVGAGLGNLTAPLLQAGAQVQAVELDARRCAGLRDRFAEAIADGSLQVLQGDALRLSPQQGPWRVVANPPFQHTAALLRAWLLKPGSAGSPSAIDLLIQTQAAGKLAGRPGAQTRSSALLGLW
jgi:23S rRNA (adenine-N6)-dimethyltransferase